MRTCSTEKSGATATASRRAKTPTFNTKRDRILRCGCEDSSHLGMVTFISLSTYNCWQQIQKKRGKKKSPSSSTKQLQSPTGFLSLLKQIQSSLLCSWNSSGAAGKASLCLRCHLPPVMAQRGQEGQGCTEHPNKAMTAPHFGLPHSSLGSGRDIW